MKDTDSALEEKLLNEALKTYGYCSEGELNYLKTHFKRYIATLELIKNKDISSILELGSSQFFTLMLNKLCPSAKIELGNPRDPLDNSNKDYSSKIILKPAKAGTANDLIFNLNKFNLEKEPWPYSNSSFDIVICMEILEHLLLDPFFVFKEANRVLKDNGNFILTTPNIACYESLEKLLQGISPYRYGVYSCYGEYGRHNREYVPEEINKIGQDAGFATSLLYTKDTYCIEMDISRIKNILDNLNDDPTLRGQTIFYRGVKQTDKSFKKYPEYLYDCDKELHCAKIQLLKIDKNVTFGEKINADLRISNNGKYIWENTGSNITCVGIILLDKHKNLIERDFQRIYLPKKIKTGDIIEISSTIKAPDIRGSYVFRFDMVHENICWFSDSTTPYFSYVDVDIEIN